MMTRQVFGLISALLGIYLSNTRAYYSLEVGDPCPTRDYRSSCQPAEQCTTIGQLIDSGRLTVESIMNCGYSIRGEKVCCPLDEQEGSTALRFSSKGSSNIESTTTTTTTTTMERPQWLSIFKTSREYVQRSIATSVPFSRDSIVFPDTLKRNGAACQTPLYEGKCLGISQCPSLEPLLQQRRLRDDDVQTCRHGTIEEIICCPINLPLTPRGQVGTDTRAGSQPSRSTTESQENAAGTSLAQDQEDEEAVQRAALLLPHYTHLAALAYPNAAFDGHLHRCTALALTSQLLLTVAGCGSPSHAVFGVADMRDVDVDEDYLVDIAHVDVLRQDLELLRLEKPLELGPKRTLAPMCTHFELTRLQTSGQLLASAWAKGNDSDCPFYEMPMRLLPFDACRDIDNVAGVQNLPASHLCVGPIHLDTLGANNASSCAPCPAVVGSVLHLRRPSGSRCVLGLATPTGDSCDAQSMYYTSVLDAQLIDFVEQQQQQ